MWMRRCTDTAITTQTISIEGIAAEYELLGGVATEEDQEAGAAGSRRARPVPGCSVVTTYSSFVSFVVAQAGIVNENILGGKTVGFDAKLPHRDRTASGA